MTADSPSVCFDLEREARIGLPEAVFCEGKPREALLTLFRRFAEPSQKPILFTRLSDALFAQLPESIRLQYDYDPLSRTAWHHPCEKHAKGLVAIVSAGTSDAVVAREASRTLQYLGYDARRFEDCGVAGLWRLQKALPEINKADVVIVIAGLDAAIASVLGGLTGKPLFAVPTSIGYGMAEGGKCALSSMLTSCAPGIAVMNIDNGYGAACAAARVLRAMGY